MQLFISIRFVRDQNNYNNLADRLGYHEKNSRNNIENCGDFGFVENKTSEFPEENQKEDMKKTINLFISNPSITFSFNLERKRNPNGSSDMMNV